MSLATETGPLAGGRPARPQTSGASAAARPAGPVLPRSPAAGRGPQWAFLNSIWQVARKDIQQHIRTKRVLIIGSFMLLSLVLVTYILPVHVFEVEPDQLDEGYPNQAMTFYLMASVFGGAFIIQLLAIVITSDAVSSEWSKRTIFLLLSKPVSRSAFVLGKFLGSVLTVVPTFLGLMLLDYLVLGLFVADMPNGEDWGRFLGALGLLTVGALAITALALFFSTLTRSSVTGLILCLVFTFVAFPLLGNWGDFVYFADDASGGWGRSLDQSQWKYDWSHYFSPERPFSTATKVLTGEEGAVGVSFVIPSFPPASTVGSVVSGLLFTAGFVVASLFVVNRRNFE